MHFWFAQYKAKSEKSEVQEKRSQFSAPDDLMNQQRYWTFEPEEKKASLRRRPSYTLRNTENGVGGTG